MIRNYTVAQFRKQLREAFNQADEGDIVIINRYGSTYELTNMDNKPKKTNVQLAPATEPGSVQSVQIAKKPVSRTNPTSHPTSDVARTIPAKKPEPFKFPPSAASGLDVIKTPEEAKKAVETPQFISKDYSSRKKGSKLKDKYEELGF